MPQNPTMAVDTKGAVEVQEYLDRMPKKLFQQAKDVFTEAVTAADKRTKHNIRMRMHNRTGMLRRSLRIEVKGTDLESLRASTYGANEVAGKQVIYHLVHELGAHIKAKDKYLKVPGGPYLNIPTDENKTAAGVTRMTAREVFAAGGFIAGRGVYRYNPTISVDSYGHASLSMGDLMFVLVKSVNIPPRLGMIKAADRQVRGLLLKLQDLAGEE